MDKEKKSGGGCCGGKSKNNSKEEKKDSGRRLSVTGNGDPKREKRKTGQYWWVRVFIVNTGDIAERYLTCKINRHTYSVNGCKMIEHCTIISKIASNNGFAEIRTLFVTKPFRNNEVWRYCRVALTPRCGSTRTSWTFATVRRPMRTI